MKKTITYNKIEKVTYVFDKYDIREALFDYYKIPSTHNYEIDFDGDAESINIVIDYVTKEESK